ncbi:MAG: acyl carrier protein [Caldilineaceae bacterium]
MSNVLLSNPQSLQAKSSPNGSAKGAPRSAADIQQWLTGYLANLLELPHEKIAPTVPFDAYGLDSAAAVGMTGALESWLGQDVDPTLPYIYTTIATLAQHLATGVDIKAHDKEAV